MVLIAISRLAMQFKSLGAIAVVLLMFVGCTKGNKFEEFSPIGAEPKTKLIFEREWGQSKDRLGKSEDVWNPSFEHYFVRGDEVFIADQVSAEVKYFKGGKYIRSYDYSFVHGDLSGLIVIDDVMYWFVD